MRSWVFTSDISGAGNSVVFPLDLLYLMFDHVNYNWIS